MGTYSFPSGDFSSWTPDQLLKSRKFWAEARGFAVTLAQNVLHRLGPQARRWETSLSAEDLASGALENLFQGLSNPGWNQAPYRVNFGGALRTFLQSRILDQLKKHRQRARRHPFTPAELATPGGLVNLLDRQDRGFFGPAFLDPLTALISQENQKEFLSAVERLPGILKAVAHLELYQNATPRETAKILGIPVETVYRHRQTLRRQLQRELKAQGFAQRFLA